MVGGSGEKHLLKVVAKHANRYNLFFGSPDEMKRKISILKEYCSSIGRNHKDDLEYSVVLPCIIRDSEEEVNEILLQTKREDKSIKEYSQYPVDSILIGLPEKVLQGIRKYLDIDVTHFMLHFIGLNNNSILRHFDSSVITKI
jgi:alkanesulfonate monooxygenase SsuD/methylene tetrahydromethanopterin reductase-like flavin-dependent oxidoreductase (luciferase family)